MSRPTLKIESQSILNLQQQLKEAQTIIIKSQSRLAEAEKRLKIAREALEFYKKAHGHGYDKSIAAKALAKLGEK
jgi:hypothetical protein